MGRPGSLAAASSRRRRRHHPANEVGRRPRSRLTMTQPGRRLVISHDARNDLGTVREDASAAARPRNAERASGHTPTHNGAMNTNHDGEQPAASGHVDRPVAVRLVSDRAAARLAKALTALSAVLLVLAVVLLLLNRDLGFKALSPHLFLVPGFAVVGLVLAVRRPDHAIGWLFVGMGLVAAVQAFAFEYAVRALVTAPGSLPAAAWMAWLATWTFLLNLPALALLLLLFPDGRVPSPRWRVVPWLLGVAIAGVTVWVMLQPGPLDLSVVKIDNPARIAALDDPAIHAVGVVPNILTFLTLFVGSVACALAPFVRRRRAGPIERQQLKWLAFVAGGSGLAGATGLLLISFASSAATIVGGLLLVVALVGVAVGIPVAVGLAILRYRLYDIDRVINRTLVYGLLTAVLGLGYAGVVLVLGQVFGGVGGNPPRWAVAGATLAMAALFQPLRRRIQRAVDQRFNRRRYDTARTIQAYSARLRDQVDLDTLTGELLAVVDQTMQPTQASVWLRDNPPHHARRQPDLSADGGCVGTLSLDTAGHTGWRGRGRAFGACCFAGKLRSPAHASGDAATGTTSGRRPLRHCPRQPLRHSLRVGGAYPLASLAERISAGQSPSWGQSAAKTAADWPPSGEWSERSARCASRD
jgi:hypothetical protein